MNHPLLPSLLQGNIKSLARLITLVENELDSYFTLLTELPPSSVKITGITGAPGAGKSTITDALIGEWVAQDKRVGVLCVDPSSPFNKGALLGDRIRMNQWYNHPAVYIRSLASRGSLGGLHPNILEITDVMKAAGFDHIIIETVGVGQSEVEIAGIADTTIVVLTPESGDDVQSMKAGLMEIADVFVVNKADRPDAAQFASRLLASLGFYEQYHNSDIAVIKTIATSGQGIAELTNVIERHQSKAANTYYKYALLAEKAFKLIEKQRMRSIDITQLKHELEQYKEGEMNVYRFAQRYFN